MTDAIKLPKSLADTAELNAALVAYDTSARGSAHPVCDITAMQQAVNAAFAMRERTEQSLTPAWSDYDIDKYVRKTRPLAWSEGTAGSTCFQDGARWMRDEYEKRKPPVQAQPQDDDCGCGETDWRKWCRNCGKIRPMPTLQAKGPQVTDEMVERAYEALYVDTVGLRQVSEVRMRAALEAAIND